MAELALQFTPLIWIVRPGWMRPYRPATVTSNTFTDGFHGLDACSTVVNAGLVPTCEALITTDGREAGLAP
jgi:hypothetical protein